MEDIIIFFQNSHDYKNDNLCLSEKANECVGFDYMYRVVISSCNRHFCAINFIVIKPRHLQRY